MLRSMEWKKQEEITRKEYFRRLKEEDDGDEIDGPDNAFNPQESMEPTRDSEQENLEDEAQSIEPTRDSEQENLVDEDQSSKGWMCRGAWRMRHNLQRSWTCRVAWRMRQ